MKKIKELWQKNKILVVLVTILIACFISICVVVVTYFFGGSSTVYGNRLEDIDKYPVTESFKTEYISKIKENKEVTNATIKTKGRVIYINIDFVADTTLIEAESKSTASLEQFTEELLSYYDINFILTSDASSNSDGFTIMGAKNANGTGIAWNNNTKKESSAE
ncbi:MAG: hypothetical protein RSE17_01240 [Bacilli bacterium]